VKKALFIVVGLVVLAIGAALVVPGMINWNDYRSEIAAKAREATGRRLAIDGDIGFTILPTPALQVSRLRLANLPGAAVPEMATISSLEVEVALIPLISGEIQINRVRVVKPVISIEVLADGRANYDFGSSGTSNKNSDGNTDLSLDSLVIEDAKITYIDAKSGLGETIEGLSAELSAGSLSGPFKAEGRLTARNLTTTFKASTGALNTGRSIPLNLALGLANGAGTMSFKGSISQASAEGILKGKLVVTAPDALTLAQALQPVTGSEAPELPALKQKLSINGDIEASAKSAALNNIVTKIGETTAAGAVSASFDKALNVDLALDVNRVNLDTWLQPAPEKDSANVTANTETDQPAAPFAIPAAARPSKISSPVRMLRCTRSSARARADSF